ncbi:hypothetical protein [Albibacillus kandeliae]|uniref:hypothetical protein n=1 Tax=Albibacillus kandeliae TaxID=2174228 RepID=UPI000D69C0A4|nr:hypothetical protein [Albibacillus kandeliae]
MTSHLVDERFSTLLAALGQGRAAGAPSALDPAGLPETLAEAYGIAMAQAPEVAAWKIGGANPWSQKVFGNAEVFFGPLVPDELQVSEAEAGALPLAGLCAPLAEPEIMLEIADPEAGTFARMGLGFEIPASVLPEAAKPRLAGQVCDRAGAGALWIGAVRPFDGAALEAAFPVGFDHNGGAPVAGDSGNVKGGPVGAAREFLGLAARYGIAPAPGQWIATGGLCPAVAVRPGDRVGLDALGTRVELRFS